ncbi:MAG: GtrA family protein [Lachnospiraceae bacterium]|nr:GtrA family protein [Lachnospiraceae bacterium]
MKIVEYIVRKAFEILEKVFRIKVKPAAVDAIVQFGKFGVVGVTNTVISYVLYAGTLLLLQRAQLFPQIDYLLSQVTAFVLSVLWSFYWNNRLVFTRTEGKHRSLWRTLLKTYISYSFTGLFLSSFLLILWVQILGISEFIAPIFNLIISVPLNFLINKFWAFREK